MSTRQEPPIANALVQSSLLGEAVDGADMAILVTDPEGRCIAVNRHACALLGYSREEFLTLRVPDIAPETEPQECFSVVQGAGVTEGVAETLRSDGSELTMRYWSTQTRVAQMPLVVSLGRPESEPAAAA